MADEENSGTKFRTFLRWAGAVGLCIVLLVGGLMFFGGDLLQSTDALPLHVNAAVVLEASPPTERIRLDGAMKLLQQGVSERLLLPLAQLTFWDEPLPPMVRRFLEANYGPTLSSKVDFCEVSAQVNSTFQEAHALDKCIREHGWDSVIVVTSNYHTRRAGLIWRRVMAKDNPKLRIWMYGAADPDFQTDGWWRRRLWAKTWLLELTKLIWTETVDRWPRS